mmetsp:Transcript_46953/g.130772  ORF Transcript_46953/g.130772 Transcript_46953/m.130772 type:complete len:206 (-) Transcript_46953:157-774(-)
MWRGPGWHGGPDTRVARVEAAISLCPKQARLSFRPPQSQARGKGQSARWTSRWDASRGGTQQRARRQPHHPSGLVRSGRACRCRRRGPRRRRHRPCQGPQSRSRRSPSNSSRGCPSWYSCRVGCCLDRADETWHKRPWCSRCRTDLSSSAKAAPALRACVSPLPSWKRCWGRRTGPLRRQRLEPCEMRAEAADRAPQAPWPRAVA